MCMEAVKFVSVVTVQSVARWRETERAFYARVEAIRIFPSRCIGWIIPPLLKEQIFVTLFHCAVCFDYLSDLVASCRLQRPKVP